MTAMIDPTLMRQTYNVPRRLQCCSSPYSSSRINSPHLLRIPFFRLSRTIPELASACAHIKVSDVGSTEVARSRYLCSRTGQYDGAGSDFAARPCRTSCRAGEHLPAMWRHWMVRMFPSLKILDEAAYTYSTGPVLQPVSVELSARS